MAGTELCIGLLLLLTCCSANAQGWGSWFWGSSEKTTVSATEAVSHEEQTTQLLATPEAATPSSSPESTTQEKGKVWNIFTLKRPDITMDITVPTATPPAELGDREENIAGVGAEILNVAEGIRNLVQLWDDKTTEETERTKAPTTADFVEASPVPVTDPVSTQNTTVNFTGDVQPSLQYGQPVNTQNVTVNSTSDVQISPQTAQPELALSEATQLALLWNKTKVLLRKPEIPPPGSASFSFSSDDQGSGDLMDLQESTDVRQESVATSGRRADWGAFSANGGILSSANDLELQEPQANSSVHVGIRSKVVGALDNWLSHYVTNSSQSISYGNRTHLSLKKHPLSKHSGIAVADANKNHSRDSVYNSNATNFMDFPPANSSESLEFLLTYTMQRFSNSSKGLPSFFPGLTPTAGHCLPLPTKLSYCNNLGMKHFRVPNYLHHGSEEEIRAALHEWEGLLKSRCHRYLEWFFCLLLVPGCNASLPITPPPCRGFCEALKDLCWIHLKEGHLPIPCDSLPAEDGVYSCVFVNVSAGNVQGLISLTNSFSLCPRPGKVIL